VSENLYIFDKNLPSKNILVLLLVASWCLWQVVVFHYHPFFTLAFWWCNCFWMHDRALRPCSLSLKIRCAYDYTVQQILDDQMLQSSEYTVFMFFEPQNTKIILKFIG